MASVQNKIDSNRRKKRYFKQGIEHFFTICICSFIRMLVLSYSEKMPKNLFFVFQKFL